MYVEPVVRFYMLLLVVMIKQMMIGVFDMKIILSKKGYPMVFWRKREAYF